MSQRINMEQIICFLKGEISTATNSEPNSIDEKINFMKFGISSMQTIMILNKVKKKFEIEVNPFAMFEYKNINELSHYLYGQIQVDKW